MNSAAGFAAIERAKVKLRALGKLPAQAAQPVADAMRDITAENIARGVGPDGTPWQPTKAGNVPLRNAAKALSTSAVGSVAILRLEGPEVRHNNGTARGHVKRQILPSQRMPQPFVAAVDRVVTERFRSIMK